MGHKQVQKQLGNVSNSMNVNIGMQENEATYLMYCNTFIDLHHRCLGGDLMYRYIGR